MPIWTGIQPWYRPLPRWVEVLELYLLVIVDSTAAPALHIVGQYSCSLCSSLKYTDS